MDSNRLAALLSHRRPIIETLTEIQTELDNLHARLARVLDTEVGHWSARMPIDVDRATFETLPGTERFYQNDGGRPFWTKYPTIGVVVYCYAGPFPDHDLTAENAPDEWAATTHYGDSARHYFWRYSPVAGAEDIWTRVIDSVESV